jgi:hypothetical protein
VPAAGAARANRSGGVAAHPIRPSKANPAAAISVRLEAFTMTRWIRFIEVSHAGGGSGRSAHRM